MRLDKNYGTVAETFCLVEDKQNYLDLVCDNLNVSSTALDMDTNNEKENKISLSILFYKLWDLVNEIISAKRLLCQFYMYHKRREIKLKLQESQSYHHLKPLMNDTITI